MHAEDSTAQFYRCKCAGLSRTSWAKTFMLWTAKASSNKFQDFWHTRDCHSQCLKLGTDWENDTDFDTDILIVSVTLPSIHVQYFLHFVFVCPNKSEIGEVWTCLPLYQASKFCLLLHLSKIGLPWCSSVVNIYNMPTKNHEPPPTKQQQTKTHNKNKYQPQSVTTACV